MPDMHLRQVLKGLDHEIDWSLVGIHRIELGINKGPTADILHFSYASPSKKYINIFFAVNANLTPCYPVPFSHNFNF
jgi:hypothetical protein